MYCIVNNIIWKYFIQIVLMLSMMVCFIIIRIISFIINIKFNILEEEVDEPDEDDEYAIVSKPKALSSDVVRGKIII